MTGKADFGILRIVRNESPKWGAAGHYLVVRVHTGEKFLDLAFTEGEIQRAVERSAGSAAEETLVATRSWKDKLCAWIMRL